MGVAESLRQNQVLDEDFRGRYLGWVISTLALLIYLVTLSRHYTADSLLFALAIENGGIEALIDPTHILLHPLGWIWYQMWRLAGWVQGSLIPLGVLNALAGAICVGLLYSLARRMLRSDLIAGIVAAGFALSGGLWFLSVEAEFVTVPLVLALLVLWLTLVPSETLLRMPLYPVIVGLAAAVSILSFVNNIFLVPVVIIGLWLRTEITVRRRWRAIFLFIIVTFLFALPIMLASIALWTRGDWSRVVQLFGGGVYGQLGLFNIPQGLYAFLRTFALFQGLAMNDSTELFLAGASAGQKLGFAGYYSMIALIVAVPLLMALAERRYLWSNYQREVVVLFVWSILYAAFGFYWVPGDISFWLPLLVAWWLLLGFVLAARAGSANRIQLAYYLLPITFVTAIAIANSIMVIWPRRELSSNPYYLAANEVASQTMPGDMVAADATNIESIYLVYFADRFIVPVSDIGIDNQQLKRDLEQTIQIVQGRGGKAYVFRDGTLTRLEP